MISHWTQCQSAEYFRQYAERQIPFFATNRSLTLFEWLAATFLPCSSVTDRSLYEFRRPDLFLIYHLQGNLHIKHLSPCLKQPGLQLPPRSVHTHRHTNPHIHTDTHTRSCPDTLPAADQSPCLKFARWESVAFKTQDSRVLCPTVSQHDVLAKEIL